MDNQPPQSELYGMTKRALQLSEDTNRIVHGMRRAQRWHTLGSLVWWAIIVAISVASYYYALPYLQAAQKAYSNLQSGAQQDQQGWQQVLHSLGL